MNEQSSKPTPARVLRSRPKTAGFIAATLAVLGACTEQAAVPVTPAARGSVPKAAAPRSSVVPRAASSTAATPPAMSPEGGLCSPSGWCWRNPLPQGNWLAAVAGRSSSEVWAMGGGATVLRFDGHTWRKVAAPSGVRSFTALERDASGRFWAAAGLEPAYESALFEWNGSTWRDSGLRVHGEIWDVWFDEKQDAWLMPREGALHRWDGTTLHEVPSPTSSSITSLKALSGASSSDVWLATDEGLFQWNGKAWQRPPTDVAKSTAVLVRGPGDVWAARPDGSVYHLEGGRWRSWSVAGRGRPELFAGSEGSIWLTLGKAIYRMRDAGFQETVSDLGADAMSLWIAPDGTGWAVGERGLLTRWDGQAWSRPAASERNIWVTAIGGSADDDVWVAARKYPTQAMFHWDGRELRSVPLPEGGVIHAIWVASKDDVWAAGDRLLHWDGKSWSAVPAHLWFQLRSLWGSGPNDVWAAGRDGVLHFDGCRWSHALIERDAYFKHGGSWGAEDVWVVGGSDVLWYSVAGVWKWERNGQGVVLGKRPDGTWLRTAPVPPTSGKAGALVNQDDHVVVRDAGTAWVLALRGGVLHWDGQRWHDTHQDLDEFAGSALWVSPGGEIWFGGMGSVLLSKQPHAAPAGGGVSRPTKPESAAKVHCGTDFEHVQLEALLETAPRAGPKRPLPAPDAAIELARRWLEALRDADIRGVSSTSALPLRAAGFQAGGFPHQRCGDTLAKRSDGVYVDATAQDTESFRNLLDCLLANQVLTIVTPRRGKDQWQSKAPDAGGNHVAGRLQVVTPDALAPRLVRYRKQARDLVAGGHVLVEAHMTDGAGFTVRAILAVRATPSGPRVAALLLDEQFQE